MAKQDYLKWSIGQTKLTGSFKTRYNHLKEAERFVETLRELKYGVAKWDNISNKHVAAVVNRWQSDGLTDKTIKEYLSGVRAIARSYGNDHISPSNSDFGIEKISVTRHGDQSITNEQYNQTREKLIERTNIDDRANLLLMQLDAMRYLGLRTEEARKLDAVHSKRDISPSGIEYIRIDAGTKGGKERWVPLISDEAKEVIKRIETYQKNNKTKTLLPKEMKERQWVSYMYRAGREVGLTHFHGLRHAWAQDYFYLEAGFSAPIKFANKAEFEQEARLISEKWGERYEERYESACRQIEKALGHEPDRSDIRGTYIGRL